jgi:site-specific DNA recombinase
MTKRAVIYARYSSDLQSDASIEDQVRLAKRLIDDQKLDLTQIYTDHGISGASLLRPGYQQLLTDARAGMFEVVIAESIDRLSRDQEHIAAFHKAMNFSGISVITTSEGVINELHIGLKGTMSALYLKDLADKTRRGLEGRVRKGKSGGGLCYGYRVDHKYHQDGSAARGDRYIEEPEAQVVRRIFEEYQSGKSPKSIAHELNEEGVPGPKGGQWSPSSIYGNWRRGTGILNNELYVGRIVWNRQRYIKDPISGKRQARLNPEHKWVVEEVPSLQIVDEGLWKSVKDKQLLTRRAIENNSGRLEAARRPRYLLSGLLQCGSCGGGFSKISKHHYGCSTARNKATCNNLLTIRRDTVEELVLVGLKERLLQPVAYKAFIEEFTREYNAKISQHAAFIAKSEVELQRTNLQIQKLIDAIKIGIPAETVKEEIQTLHERRAKLEHDIKSSAPKAPYIHPNLSAIYRNKVNNLIQALNDPNTIAEANTAIRELIERVRLVPEGSELKVELYGELAALLRLGSVPNAKHLLAGAEEVQVSMVAGAGFEPAAFRL